MWGVLIAIVACCFIAYSAVQGVLNTMDEWLEDLPAVDSVDLTSSSEESLVYAADGETLLAQFKLENRQTVELDAVSDYVLQATVDTEDTRFYEHNGVDLTAIARAVVNNLAGGDLEGASTITMQLVRNTLLADEADDISFRRKVREAQLALELEELYSKDEILIMYLNTINYGDGCYGIEAAAEHYFSTSAADLTLAQAATLAGIPQSPTYLNPVNYPDACLERRNTVLARMLSAGDITQDEYEAAVAEPLGLDVADDDPEDGIFAYPYFTSYVREVLLDDDNDFGVSYSDLFAGGLTIYTTLDVELQETAEEVCDEQRARMSSDLDTALVAMDPDTGYVLALVGGADYSESQVNLATGSGGTGRMAGSTFKAFTLCAAIEQGIDPDTKIDCSSPLVLSDGETEVSNFSGKGYGTITIREALARSSNTGFVRLSQEIGSDSVEEMAERLGIPEDSVGSYEVVTLGSSAVTPLEMARAYSTFATGGIYRDAVVVTKIVDGDGNVIYEADTEGERVLSKEVAGAVTDVLQGVFESSVGTAYGSGPSNGQEVAGKTGTSDDYADHWLVGYSPQLVCATWIGNPDGEVEGTSSVTCNQMWHDFMSAALADEELVEFEDVDEPEYDSDFNNQQAAVYDDDDDDDDDAEDPDDAPDMTGRTYASAQSALSGWNVSVSYEYSDTVEAGYVISQSVSGDTVVLVVSSGQESGDSEDADDTDTDATEEESAEGDP